MYLKQDTKLNEFIKTKNNYFSKELSKYGLNLPSGHNLTKNKIDYIVKTINDTVK